MVSIHKTQEKLYEVLSRPECDSLSLRQIASLVGVKSPNTVTHHLKQLEKKGYIFRDKKSKRIEVLKNPVNDLVFLNLYGMAECGPGGIFTEENTIERIPLPAKTFKVTRDSFLVEAVGDSMYPEVEEGDLVLAEKDVEAKNGDMVVVIHNETAKIKKFFKGDDRVILQSINPSYPPISAYYSGELSVCGVVTGIVRKFGRDK
tara:strand:+ start:1473 stop:2081 length:609 start_codon:yes stop_codon:yes gene_type:complete